MNRIFKNAVVPILVVILLAFLAQRLLLNNDSSEAPPKNWSTLLGDLKDGDVTALDQNVNSNDVKVTLKPVDGKAAENYTVGIPGDAAWEQIYDANKDKLKDLVIDQAYVAKELDQLEAEWLEKQAQLESLQAAA